MYSNLDAKNFDGSIQFYDTSFEDFLSKLTTCYKMMISDKVILDNDENNIRNVLLLKYLKNNQVRQQIGFSQWLFDREVQEDHSVGRTDIKISSIDTFSEQEAYYIIECKRLDNVNTSGVSGLNAEYIKNGISRFIQRYYSSYFRVNAMIGFIVNEMDIHLNTDKINILLKASTTINTTKEITKDNFICDFKYHYHSEHYDKNNDGLKIYHLMFDFSGNIQR